jgi:diadenylate cyclase
LSFLSALQRDLQSVGWTTIIATVVDVTLVALAVYWVIMLSRRRPAWQILWGLLVFLGLVFLTEQLQLHTINFLLTSFLRVLPLAVVILFQPELRQMLENMGSVAGWGRGFAMVPTEEVTSLIQLVSHSAVAMSERKIGALIVIERESALDDIAATGTRLNASISEELIGSIFNPGSPLHDGAIIIRGTRIVAAGCTLPLSESAHVGTMIHTRHKAGLGVAEESDAAVVVVSEETGTISLALEGKLHRGLDQETLVHWLGKVCGTLDDPSSKAKFARTVDGTLRKARLRRK